MRGRGYRFGSTLETSPDGATEGFGVYIATSPTAIDFFRSGGGQQWEVEYVLHNPLVNDDEEPYGFDIENNLEELLEPIQPDDSEWVKVHKEAVAAARKARVNPKNPAAFNKILTDVMKRHGYDGVRAKWGTDEWVVVFDPHNIRVIVSAAPSAP